MNHELKLLVQWLRSKKLFLNEAVTERNIFKSPCKQLPGDPDIRINNYFILYFIIYNKFKINQFFKCLSVPADEVLSWNTHGMLHIE